VKYDANIIQIGQTVVQFAALLCSLYLLYRWINGDSGAEAKVNLVAVVGSLTVLILSLVPIKPPTAPNTGRIKLRVVDRQSVPIGKYRLLQSLDGRQYIPTEIAQEDTRNALCDCEIHIVQQDSRKHPFQIQAVGFAPERPMFQEQDDAIHLITLQIAEVPPPPPPPPVRPTFKVKQEGSGLIVESDSTIQLTRHSGFLAVGQGDFYLEATRPSPGTKEVYDVTWFVDGRPRHGPSLKMLQGSTLLVDFPGNPPVDLGRPRTIGVEVRLNGAKVFGIEFKVVGIVQ